MSCITNFRKNFVNKKVMNVFLIRLLKLKYSSVVRYRCGSKGLEWRFNKMQIPLKLNNMFQALHNIEVLNFTFRLTVIFVFASLIQSFKRKKMERTSTRVSASQWDIALEFLESNPSMIRGYNNSARGRQLSQSQWQQLTVKLNAEGSGATKTPKAWAIYFNNHKAKLKKTVSAITAEATGTGGGPALAESLSDIDMRFVALMGPGFGQGNPNVMVNPFPNTRVEQVQPPEPANIEIQQETEVQETVSEVIMIATGIQSPQPSTSGVNQETDGRSPPPMGNAPAQPLPRRTRRTRYHTRPMAPLDEARRILSQVEMQRAAADAEQARALHLIAENLGRLARAAETYLARNSQ